MSKGGLAVIFDLDQTLVDTALCDGCNFQRIVPLHMTPGADRLVGLGFEVLIRPGAVDMLRRLRTVFTVALFSMGHWSYVHSIVGGIDPDGSIFGDRIFTRDDADPLKYIPIWIGDSNTVVAVDDNVSVWKSDVTVIAVPEFDCTSPLEINNIYVMSQVERLLMAAYAAFQTDNTNRFDSCCGAIRIDPLHVYVGTRFIYPTTISDIPHSDICEDYVIRRHKETLTKMTHDFAKTTTEEIPRRRSLSAPANTNSNTI